MGIKVSVLITTYNQERFIAQTVQSALGQQTSFDYEIVIGDDCSTDGTRDILRDLQQAHPDKIRLLLRERNLGMSGKNNYLGALKTCRGAYIAPLDGDDYWTSPHKLQKQADFLDSHADFTVCFHDALGLDESAPDEAKPMAHVGQKAVSTLEDIVAGNFILPCAVMFRHHLWEELPPSFYTILNGDWMFYVLCAEHGKIGFIGELMAVYRIHSGGEWSKLTFIERIRQHIKTYEAIDEHLKFKFHPLISEKIAALQETLSAQHTQHAIACLDRYHALARSGQISKALPLLAEAARFAPAQLFLRPRRLAAVLKNGLLGLVSPNKSTPTEN